MSIVEGYEIREVIHESANSRVFRAWRREDRAPVVLKLLKKDYPSAVELTRYRQEYEITRSLELDCVIRAFDQCKHENSLVIVLEDFGGESLSKLLGRRGFTLVEMLDIASKVTAALGEIHARQVIHRDINPSNIVFNPATGKLKVIDFGVSTRFSRQNQVLKSPDVLEGTLAYMSPEQTGRMNRSVDYRTDFYSLGVSLYHLVTGHLPFKSEDAMEVVHFHIAREPPLAHERSPDCPPGLSRIIRKLMAKAAEERYQSAWGILADLKACRWALVEGRNLEDFVPGREDHSERFQLPQRLYGRDAEITAVLEAFGRASEGPSELLLVSGYSGVGKSALIQEVYKPITHKRGYFISGKFDQLQRNVPFSALVSALRDLVRQLLTEREEHLLAWKRKLLAALGPSGQVIVDLIPDLELIIGPQPPSPELGATEAMNRFHMAFLGLIRVFRDSGHPLVIFLDDLQWADSATLTLLDLMMTDEGTEHLFLIGAYRDNEVNALHPLSVTVEGIRGKGGRVSQLTLAPLGSDHVAQLIAETLHREPADVGPLTRLVVAKTQGNPFFVGQFLETLHQESLITRVTSPDGEKPRWRWDISRIEAAGITDNVVVLMISKLRRLPEATQNALRLAACIGNRFDLWTLALIQDREPTGTFADLFPAVQESLILPASEFEVLDPAEPLSPLLIQHYRFQHDRVQQSAYGLFDAGQVKGIHLRIGRRLLDTLGPAQLNERLFEVVDHLDLGRELIQDVGERRRLSELNMEAGRKALESTAYAAALQYLLVAREMLPDGGWDCAYPLAMGIHRLLGEVEYLNGHFESAEEVVNLTLEKARTDLEKAEIHCMLIVQYTMRAKFAEAIEAGRQVLALAGIDLRLDRLGEAASAGLKRVAELRGARPIASLIDMPDMVEPQLQVAQRALRHLCIAAFLSNQDLFPVIVTISMGLSLEHGNAPEAALTYANYGLILGAFLGRYDEGAEFGELGLKLCEKFHPRAPTATVCLVAGSELVPWVKHVRHAIPVIEQGYRAGMESGDILWVGYLVLYKACLEAFQGKPLRTVMGVLRDMRAVTLRTKNQSPGDALLAYELLLPRLMGAGAPPHEELDEAGFVERCTASRNSMALCYYFILKAQEHFLLQQPEEALAWTRRAEPMLAYIVNNTQLADHNFYQSLSLAALYPQAEPARREELRARLEANQQRMGLWAASCPENFAHKHLLVSAELARISGDHAGAIELYDRAIAVARDDEFLQDQGLAHELAGRYWLSRGRKERIALMYLRDAHYAYELWGAQRKVDQLEAEFQELRRRVQEREKGTGDVTITGSTVSKALDLASVLKASQAISGEIALADLLRKMVRIVIENAGAQKGVILLKKAGVWSIEARASVDAAQGVTQQSEPLDTSHAVSAAVVHYVVKTASTLVLRDATRDGQFTADPYVVATRPKSILCMPIIRNGRLSGVLYLENNLSEGAFTEERLEVLRVLASQAAISLENATLYAALEINNQTLEQKVEERTQDIFRTRDQLIAQEKMAWMGTLSMGIAHEIKNPLNFVNNFAALTADAAQELLETLTAGRGQPLDDGSWEQVHDVLTDITENVKKIRQHGLRADGIIESMKRLAEGGTRLPSETDINNLVEEFSKLVHHGRSAKGNGAGVSVLKEYDGTLGRQWVSSQNLGRVLTSVLHNAYDAVEDRQKAAGRDYAPTVLIQTANFDKHFEIRIRDNGMGIPEKHLKNIREPFFTTKPMGTGHIGLGLAISRDIVVLEHHGELLVDSREGDYAQFTIRLPKGLAAHGASLKAASGA